MQLLSCNFFHATSFMQLLSCNFFHATSFMQLLSCNFFHATSFMQLSNKIRAASFSGSKFLAGGAHAARRSA
jgi:hypothetical protein